MPLTVVLATQQKNGGGLVALGFAKDATANACPAELLCIWKSTNAMEVEGLTVEHLTSWTAKRWSAIWQLPLIWIRFLFRRLAASSEGVFVFTHYVTLPFAWVIPRKRRVFLVQDLEWKFLRDGTIQSLLKAFIVAHYRRGSIVCANEYLADSLKEIGLEVAYTYPIWADNCYLVDPGDSDGQKRKFDVCIMLRKGKHKRPDLQHEFLEWALKKRRLAIALISIDAEALIPYRSRVATTIANPSVEEMSGLYANTKVFLLLSEHEGFGLPPLEAMGAGCIPMCRDSGGVRAYMDTPELSKLLLGKNLAVPEIHESVEALCEDLDRINKLSIAARRRFQEGLDLSDQRKEVAARIVRLSVCTDDPSSSSQS